MPGTAHTTKPGHPQVQLRDWASSWIVELVLVLCLTAGMRAYVVWQTPIIAKDGMLYVGIARMINHGMWLDLVGDWFLFNPYPALIAWLQRCGLSFDFSGQLISAAASSLAVWPLYLWCRRAFDQRVALLAGLTYALHPVMLRFSGQVLREGLYWGLMLWGVYAFWQAAQYRTWWRYVLAGLITTAATLTRMEGAVIFVLGALWTLTLRESFAIRVRSADQRDQKPSLSSSSLFRSWLPDWPSTFRILLSGAMFPLTIVLLNLLLIPAGQGWHGCGRWVHFATRLTRGTDAAQLRTHVADRMREVVSSEQARQSQLQPRIDDVRNLAKSLPAWNPLGEPDLAQLRLQRFLILADDQRLFLFAGRFLNECWDGLLFPCVLCCCYGLSVGCRANWSPRRDWPLAVMAVLLSGLLIYHLSTEFILEPRYMFCLIPFVFPWSGIGAREMYRRLDAWYAVRPTWSAWRPNAVALSGLLMVLAVAKLSMGLEDRGKLVQRELGARLRHTTTGRLKIAGPESLRRVGHYAEADYFIIPRGDAAAARRWLSEQRLDFVVMPSDELPTLTNGEPLFSGDETRYRPWDTDHLDLGKIQVYWVDPAIRMWGS